MKNFLVILIAIVLSLLIAVGAFFAATGLMNSLYDYRSPLSTNPPSPQVTLGAPSTQRLVIVLIDGLRLDTSLNSEVMPTLASLRAQGASAIMVTRPPSYSQTEYSVIFTGAWPELSDGPAFNVSTEDIPSWTQDNLFSSAHRAGMSTAISGFDWFEHLVPMGILDEAYFTAGEDRVADEAVTTAALSWLDSGCCQLTLIHLDQVDYAGHHEGGPRNSAWNEAAARSDALLAEILSHMDLATETVLVIADHGHVMVGGHGGDDPEALQVPFVLAGSGVNPGIFETISTIDLAPTMAALLGIGLPASAQGSVQETMLNLDSQVASEIPHAESMQQQALLTTYRIAIGAPEIADLPSGNRAQDFQAQMSAARSTRQLSEIPGRVLLSMILFAVILYAVIKVNKGGLGWIGIALFIYLLIFHIGYVVVGEWGYSFSFVTSPTGLILTGGISALAALFVTWLVYFLGRRLWKKEKINAFKASNGLSLALLAVLIVPLMAVFIQAGFPFTWMLPNIGLTYLALLSMVELLFIALGGILLAGISMLITSRKNSENI